MAVNANTLINFGTSGTSGLNIGDWTYSPVLLTAPTYLPLNNDNASYLTSSYPALGAIYAPTTVAYSAASITVPWNTTINSSNNPFSFVFGNNIFLGWNPNGNIITSPDTVNWSTYAINTDYIQKATNTSANGGVEVAAIPDRYPWLNMAYGNGRFVAIRNAPIFPNGTSSASNSTSSIGATAVSIDNGVTWMQGTLPQFSAIVQTNWHTIGFGNGRFVASGYTGYTGSQFFEVLAYSTDGIEWSYRTAYDVTSYATYMTLSNIAYGNGLYVAVSVANDASNQHVWYTTGNASGSTLQWALTIALPTAQKWQSIAFGNGVFVAVGSGYNNANTTAAASSANGTTWTARTMPASLPWTSVTFANGYFVAVATLAGTDAVATSTDGITWTLRTSSTSVGARGVIAGGKGKFVYMDGNGSVNTATVINLSTAASTFTLPIASPVKGMIPYIKAT